MPAITGKQYIDRIDQLNTEIWIDGKRVTGKISQHPAFKGAMLSQAALFDMQHDPKLKDILTYPSPSTGDAVGLSFIEPKTKEDLVKKRIMVQEWARATNGLMGRSPDYMNTTLMAYASSAKLLEGESNCFPQYLQSYYEYVRENDLTLTHSFIEPQVNRAFYYLENEKEPIAAKVVGENEDGIIIKGARLLATQGGMTDEILVYSIGSVLDEGKGYLFSIPSNTKGVKFICRESLVGGESSFDYPLSSKYEEMDTIVVFDDVIVPWERVFIYDNTLVANEFMLSSSFQPFTLHQVIARQIVKTEFVLGIVQSIIKTINIAEYQHVQEKASEVIVALESLKALLMKSEMEAKINKFGLMEPDRATLHVAITIYPKVYPRITEIVQLLGASGLMTIPTEADFNSPLRKDLDQYLQAKAAPAEERVKLFRLAWDLTMSPFGTRQTIYERFFFGDPIRVASQLYFAYDKEPYVQRIKDILK
ncbi:MAG: 4-hydroxyphenylacetate 3-monooxygenase, oxygenase component [Psychrobacillus sp.]